MSGSYPPLTCKKVKCVLSFLKFTHRDTRGSHENWVSETPSFRKVTVDCPKAPFSPFLISSIASQAGISKKKFYELASKNC